MKYLSADEPQVSAGQQYTLRAINNSTKPGSMCVFQPYPDPGVASATPLAWLSKWTIQGMTVLYQWTVDYNFVWGETGPLVPGVIFDASQILNADLQNTNKVTFTHAGGTYEFINQTKGPQPGTLYVTEDITIPRNEQASVGIGMSGFGTFIVQAEPNINLAFMPFPQYFIAFGDFQQGEALDLATIKNSAMVPFPKNVFSMTAILNPNNSWTITPTASANDALTEARSNDPDARFGADGIPYLRF
jgi:hypothetical protein